MTGDRVDDRYGVEGSYQSILPLFLILGSGISNPTRGYVIEQETRAG